MRLEYFRNGAGLSDPDQNFPRAESLIGEQRALKLILELAQGVVTESALEIREGLAERIRRVDRSLWRSTGIQRDAPVTLLETESADKAVDRAQAQACLAAQPSLTDGKTGEHCGEKSPGAIQTQTKTRGHMPENDGEGASTPPAGIAIGAIDSLTAADRLRIRRICVVTI